MRIIGFALVFVLLSAAIDLPAGSLVSAGYFVTDLGTLGGNYAWASAISDRGQVVGASTVGSSRESHAFIWSEQNGMRHLCAETASRLSYAWDINNNGIVVGSITTGTGSGGVFLWSMMEGFRELGTLGGTEARAESINNRGDVVGWIYYGPDLGQRAFLWREGVGLRDLGTLGGAYSSAQSINDLGQVVGWSYTEGSQSMHAFIWTEESGMQDLGLVGGANDINNRGQVVGYTILPGSGHISPFMWTAPDHIVYLSDELGHGAAINDAGLAVGSGGPLWVWSQRDGMRSLGVEGTAIDINAQGEIVLAFNYSVLRLSPHP